MSLMGQTRKWRAIRGESLYPDERTSSDRADWFILVVIVAAIRFFVTG
jgi:hypothetical protein